MINQDMVEWILLPDMLRARSGHGLWFNEESREMCVLGGIAFRCPADYANYRQALLRNCEVLSVGAWLETPSLEQGRAYFTPCEYVHCLFLCGGIGGTSVEIYSFQRNAFITSGLKLPEEGPTLTYVNGTELCTLSENWHCRLGLIGENYSFAKTPNRISIPRDNLFVSMPLLKSNNCDFHVVVGGLFLVLRDEDQLGLIE